MNQEPRDPLPPFLQDPRSTGSIDIFSAQDPRSKRSIPGLSWSESKIHRIHRQHVPVRIQDPRSTGSKGNVFASGKLLGMTNDVSYPRIPNFCGNPVDPWILDPVDPGSWILSGFWHKSGAYCSELIYSIETIALTKNGATKYLLLYWNSVVKNDTVRNPLRIVFCLRSDTYSLLFLWIVQ